MKPELKPCPFCGGRAYLARTGTHKQSCIVECASCGGCLETGEEGDQCGEAWNRRAQPAEPVAAPNPIRIIEGLFRSNEKRNTDQPGFQHTEGWNAALMRAMDVIRANTPLPDADIAKLTAAQATLERLGYTYHGGQEWKPPIGKHPAWVDANEPLIGPHERDLLNVLMNIDPFVRTVMNRLGGGEACGGLDCDQSHPDSTTQVVLRAIDEFESRVRSGTEPVKVPSDDDLIAIARETSKAICDREEGWTPNEWDCHYARAVLQKYGTQTEGK